MDMTQRNIPDILMKRGGRDTFDSAHDQALRQVHITDLRLLSLEMPHRKNHLSGLPF
jgi:hypothetical protein